MKGNNIGRGQFVKNYIGNSKVFFNHIKLTQTVSIRSSSSSLSVVVASSSTISFWMVRHQLPWPRLPLFRSKSLQYDTEMTYTG